MQHKSSGIVIVDKPAGITSAKVVARVKKLFGAGKVGHTGTLDPFATGVLICCINRATRLARFFLHGRKKYQAALCLGIATDTQDATGNVTFTCDTFGLSEPMIRAVFKQFEGTIEQLPPVYSALKFKGVPLYKLARSGKPTQKPARRVSVSHFEIREINLPLIHFEVSCSAGTYIRTLCADIGAALGCGGHLKALRRIEQCGFTIADAAVLSDLEAHKLSGNLSGQLISMADALQDMPEYIADKVLIEKIMHGNMITKTDIAAKGADVQEGYIKIVDGHNALIAVLESKKEHNRYTYCCVFNN